MNYSKGFKTIVALAIAGTTPASFADVMDHVPVLLGSGCESRLVAPETSGGYIPSGNCQTMFVLPDLKGQVETTAFRPTTHAILCGAVGEYQTEKIKSAMIIRKLKEKLGNTPSESGRKAIAKQISDVEAQAEKGAKFLDNKPTAVAQLLFTHGVKQSDLFQWYNNNLYISQEKGLQFERAPIGGSTLSFSMPEIDKAGEDFLVRSDIPNLIKKEDSGIRTVSFNGSLSGQLVFSPFGACALFDSQTDKISEVNKLKLSDDNLSAFLVVNRNYEVQTLSQMSYTAKVKKTEFISLFNNFAKTRTSDFKIHEFVRRNGEGKATDFVHFEAGVDKMTQSQLAQWNAMRDSVQNEVADRLATKVLNLYARFGKLVVKEETVDEAPPAGTVYVDGTQTSCSSQSIFGVRISGGCRTYSVKIPRNADGQATLLDDQDMNIDIEMQESMFVTQPYSYLYTAGFEHVTKK